MKASALPPLDTLQRYTVEEAMRSLRTSRQTVYDLIREGSLRTVTQGKRRYVPGTEIARLSATPDAESLAGIYEIAKALGVSRQVVSNWRARDHTFPAPLAELQMGPVWKMGPILRWAHETQSGRRVTRGSVRGGRARGDD